MFGTLGAMGNALQRLDPDRRRRRLRLLAEISDARGVRERLAPRRATVDQIRELVANRRRAAALASESR